MCSAIYEVEKPVVLSTELRNMCYCLRSGETCSTANWVDNNVVPSMEWINLQYCYGVRTLSTTRWCVYM